MNSQIKFWENVIIGNKTIEPKTNEQMADYKIAEYLILREKEKRAA